MDFQVGFCVFIFVLASTLNIWIHILLHISFLTGFFYFYRKIFLHGIIGSEVGVSYTLRDIVRFIFPKLVALYTPINTGDLFIFQVRKLGSQEG